MLGSHCRAIRYECHDWPFIAGRGIFSEISGLDTRWCESIRSDTICCARMQSNHDLSVSGVTISHGLISRSDRITYVPIGLLWSSLQLGLDLTRSSRSGSPNWDDLIHADMFRYVYQEPMNSVTIAYDCVLDVFHDHDRRWSRFELRLDPDGYIYMEPDWPWTSLFLELLQHKHLPSTIDDGRSCGWWQRGICSITV